MPNAIVSHADWLAARLDLLAAEKAFTHEREALAARRRALPWERVEKDYVFEGPQGQLSLADLFGETSQLVVYHFMMGPDWQEGCRSCSFWADNFNGIPIHLAHRDIAFTAISRAPIAAIEAYRQRLGWSFPWVSSLESDFNFDYQASTRPPAVTTGRVYYNYAERDFGSSEMPGISVFARGADGAIFHTYSTYGRGLDIVNGAYHFMDLTPKGRDEAGLSFPQAWVRRHDQY